MTRRVAYQTAATLCVALALSGCAFNFIGDVERPSWREQAEAACMARHPDSPFLVQASEINGKGSCGITHPLKVSAFADGSIAADPTATLGCPIVEAVGEWLRGAVQPAAMAWFGQPVVAIRQIDDYTCRTRNSVHGAKLSEHAFGNALDVAGFILEDGRTVLVRTGWRGAKDEQGFLREVEAAACQRFSTVLGPGARYHGDHFHLDLAKRSSSGSSYCNPKPQVVPPDRPPYNPERIATPIPPDSPLYTGSIHAGGVKAVHAAPALSLSD